MSAPTTPDKGGQANPLITLMCELEGIQPPSPAAYTAAPPTPLTSEQVGWVKSMIRNRELSIKKPDDADHAGGSRSSPKSEDASQEISLPVRSAQPAEPAEPATPVFECGQCGKKFKASKYLQIHLKETHIGTTCFWPGCDARFGREMALNTHLREHNARAAVDKPDHGRRCNWPGCGKLFALRETAARHLRGHTVNAKKAASQK